MSSSHKSYSTFYILLPSILTILLIVIHKFFITWNLHGILLFLSASFNVIYLSNKFNIHHQNLCQNCFYDIFVWKYPFFTLLKILQGIFARTIFNLHILCFYFRKFCCIIIFRISSIPLLDFSSSGTSMIHTVDFCMSCLFRHRSFDLYFFLTFLSVFSCLLFYYFYFPFPL